MKLSIVLWTLGWFSFFSGAFGLICFEEGLGFFVPLFLGLVFLRISLSMEAAGD